MNQPVVVDLLLPVEYYDEGKQHKAALLRYKRGLEGAWSAPAQAAVTAADVKRVRAA